MWDSPLLRACVPGVRGESCWNRSRLRPRRLSTLLSSNPRSCMENSILRYWLSLSFCGFDRVMSYFHFFFFKLFEIAHELAKLHNGTVIINKAFNVSTRFRLLYQNPRAELLRIPTRTLSIEMTCLEKILKDLSLRWVLSSMSWKFARIVIGVCFSSKSLLKTDLLIQ